MTVATAQPRWRDVFAGLALGEVVASLLLLVPLVGLSALGVATLTAPARHALFLEWPFWFDGMWSVVTDVTVIGLLACAGAPVIAYAVSACTGRCVSTRRTALILLLAGGAPLAWSHGLVPGSLLAFVAAAASIRKWAVDKTERPLRPKTWAILICLGLALTGSASAYAALHPLRITGSGGPQLMLVVENGSAFEVRVDSVRPSFPGGGPPFPFAFGFRAVSTRIAPGATTPVLLVQLPCKQGLTGMSDVRDVVVRFHLLGREEQQRLTLDSPLHLHCP